MSYVCAYASVQLDKRRVEKEFTARQAVGTGRDYPGEKCLYTRITSSSSSSSWVDVTRSKNVSSLQGGARRCGRPGVGYR